ncbi:MAG: cytochrome c oxidase accessory protein CcoG [Candidatus Polarisedimenticolaceae bacterium]|nr:cytochrome c oxidase accessory protein CcoG [Candidatus Polarisedimenticolaceae bacterium]
MSEKKTLDKSAFDDLMSEAEHWEINTGGETIHAKRIPGRWRLLKWITSAIWLSLFLGPYFRLGDRQAVLFDIPHRQFHIWSATVLPQDFWMLALVLLFFSILMAVATAMAGRIFCGFFCFQTVWTDVFTWLEEKLEGNPQRRRAMDKAPWTAKKISIKVVKHSLWLIISFLTGFSFVAWFTDVYQLWSDVFTLDAGTTAYVIIATFTAGTYFLAGFLREQNCFWLCPYARIQGVMIDSASLIPTYDFKRGEPRNRLQRSKSKGEAGDCVECKLCIAVCPTGIDIRNGSHEGCIMCGLCLDACDDIMDKLNRPRGLIRFESLDGMEGRDHGKLLTRPRVWFFVGVLVSSVLGIVYGFSTMDAVELKVIHSRLPMYVLQSDGSVQNKYTLKVLNKLNSDLKVKVTATGPEGLVLVGVDKPVKARHGNVTPRVVFVRIPRKNLSQSTESIVFTIEGLNTNGEFFSAERKSVFIGPN